MKVSIPMITYKHEAFLAQAIESVLMQKVRFPIELIIGEDYSPDRTREIAAGYQRKHPDVITLIDRGRNVGAMENWYSTWLACRGQYIAPLEGDDYWTDPSKLQRQVEAMDAHPAWTFCFHRAASDWEGDASTAEVLPVGDWPGELTIDRLVHQNMIPTCSAMYRRGVVGEFPPALRQVLFGDYVTNLLHAMRGPFGFIDREMSFYRRHRGGLWNSMAADRRRWEMHRLWRLMRPLINKASGNNALMFNRDTREVQLLMRDGQTALARRYAWQGVKARPGSPYAWRLLLWSLLGRKFGGWLSPGR